MKILRTLTSLLRGREEEGDAHAIIFHVRCEACGEVIRVRADRRWDLVEEFDDGISGYTLHKDVLGTRCNRMMIVRIAFDRAYHITARDIEGGRFATQEEHEAGG